MPYSIAQLYDQLGAQIAPGREDEFMRLVREADHRLLEFGKWSWCRDVIELTPASGIVTLPVTHIAILAARIDGHVRPVHSREFEFMATGPGEISVEGPGCSNYRLHDQGYSATTPLVYGDDFTVTGFPDNVYLNDPDYVKQVGPGENGKPDWASSTAYCKWTGSQWQFENELANVFAYSEEDTEFPWEVELWHYGASLDAIQPVGTPFDITLEREIETAAVTESLRTYKISGGIGLTEPLTVLAGKAPAVIETMEDWVHCPTLSALKLAMLAIVYEESNNLARSREYMGYALEELDAKARSIEGGAKQLHKNKENRGMGRYRSNSNFM